MDTKQDRLFSLDLLRGLDMMFLTVFAPLLWGVHAVWGLSDWTQYQLSHPWEGFTCWDIIMPLFIFICGAAIPFSLERRLERSGGKPDAGYWKHVAWRVVMLWTLGLLVQGRLASFDMNQIRFYDNTLQTIASGYLVCALAVCVPSMRFRIALPIACFVLYGVLLHVLGDYSMTGNFAFKVEKAILEPIMPATSETMREMAVAAPTEPLEAHYTWYLTSLMAVFMAFAGYFATKILQSPAAQKVKAMRLYAYGAILLALGWLLTACGVRMVKHIFTVSFTAQAMGWAALFYATLYVVADIWKVRRGFGVCVLFGQFALTAYMIEEFFKPVAEKFANMLVHGLPHLIGTPRYQPLIIAVFVVAEIIAVMAIRRRLKYGK